MGFALENILKGKRLYLTVNPLSFLSTRTAKNCFKQRGFLQYCTVQYGSCIVTSSTAFVQLPVVWQLYSYQQYNSYTVTSSTAVVQLPVVRLLYTYQYYRSLQLPVVRKLQLPVIRPFTVTSSTAVLQLPVVQQLYSYQSTAVYSYQ